MADNVETVTMTDGRKVEFAGKRRMLKQASTNPDGSISLRVDWRNGETRQYVIPTAMKDRFAEHGAEQKYGDVAAGYSETEMDDAIMDMDDLHERILKGEWNVRREGGGMSGTSTLLRAICEAFGRTPEQAKKFLSDKTQAEKMALRNSSRLKPIIERLEAEKASKLSKVNTDALLAELEA
jgi:hypothetical protein